ncbi:hypothetical protein [Flagellimonas nanhaiensis]|uniref:Uncharacterized protein n=1 Tax=Flagellimonas nanhaiensis TaxID=2292706 RepID=A0A371JKS7_9FLAO|nr:hypothetical protein [Allomuricauda nanhaiensis]RDY57563.1 hypothetical protein DX873_18565 [Allomuricauda nanhaiensis]
MKKILLTLLIIFMISCAGSYQQASHTSNQVYVGMSVKEFKEITGRKAKLEALEYGYTVYKMFDYDAWSGSKTDVKFFYFDSNGKLYKVDGGEFRQKRYQIEVINN